MIEQWFAQLGLGEYVSVFDRNDVGLEPLPFLAEEDLAHLGMTLGHRKKLVHAMGPLPAVEHSGNITEGLPAERPTHDSAERRQLTVLLCDLAGSTELATQLDPEQLRDVMRAYQAACAAVLSRHEGHVARYLRPLDGVLRLAPRARR